MFEKPTVGEQLLFSTVRIVNNKGMGSGFFFMFQTSKGAAPFIITNKHVVDGATTGEFVLTQVHKNGHPLLGQHVTVRLNSFSNFWIPHPDDEVDLCIMSAKTLIERASAQGTPVYVKHLESRLIPSQAQLEELDAIEDVLMVGYPSGVWDKANNLPVVRRGITATHPAIDFNGKPLQLLDIACFPGSSGSPVFIRVNGIRAGRDGSTQLGASLLFLIGVTFKVLMYDAKGQIHMVDAPTTMTPVISSQIPANLAIMVKARKILDFLPIIEDKMRN